MKTTASEETLVSTVRDDTGTVGSLGECMNSKGARVRESEAVVPGDVLSSPRLGGDDVIRVTSTPRANEVRCASGVREGTGREARQRGMFVMPGCTAQGIMDVGGVSDTRGPFGLACHSTPKGDRGGGRRTVRPPKGHDLNKLSILDRMSAKVAAMMTSSPLPGVPAMKVMFRHRAISKRDYYQANVSVFGIYSNRLLSS